MTPINDGLIQPAQKHYLITFRKSNGYLVQGEEKWIEGPLQTTIYVAPSGLDAVNDFYEDHKAQHGCCFAILYFTEL